MKTIFLITPLIAFSWNLTLAQDQDLPAPLSEPVVVDELVVPPDDPPGSLDSIPSPLEDAEPPALPESAVPGLLLDEASGTEPVGPAGAAATGEVAAAEPSDAEKNPFDLVLKDGRILKNYQIHSWNKTMLTIFHSTGAANIPAHVLPDNVVKAYGMDTKLSTEQEQVNRTQRTAKAAADLQAMEERQTLRKMPVVTVEGAVTSVGSDGVVLQIEDPLGIENYQRIGGMIYDKDGKPVPKYHGQIFGAVWVTDHPLQSVVVDGDHLQFQARVSGRRQVEGKTYPSIRFEKAAR